MNHSRSFADYVKQKCYDGLYDAAKRYTRDNWEDLNLYARRVHQIGTVKMTDAYIERVWVRDLPGMRVAFNVKLQLEMVVREGDYHYDETDICNPSVLIGCEGDLSCGLDDWQIKNIEPYRTDQYSNNPLSDTLVPYISRDMYEREATNFLRRYYPAALEVTPYGEAPVFVDPRRLTERMGLNIIIREIRNDAAIYGQIYFADTEAEFYDPNTGMSKTAHIDKGTIVVDPRTCLFRNVGSVNNTIIHECVHWDKHKKVFALEKLYNDKASSISCEVVGGAISASPKRDTTIMEIQANQLTPRIQMPAEPFKAKAREYIKFYMQQKRAQHTHEVMEQIIQELADGFGVSKQAAKIRLVELGFSDAIGTFTYIDGHYVRPHSFRKGVLKYNQTFSISAQDAAIERFQNAELRKLTENGDYLFIENHYVYNAPMYVQKNLAGRLELTDYALAHMDECCLIFDMEITSAIESNYHSECYLNRDQNNYTFELRFHNGYQNIPEKGQINYRKKLREEEIEIRRQMTDDPKQCMALLLDWRKMNYSELGDIIERNPKTISRIVNGETATSVETAALICFALNLPPSISEKLMDVLGCRLNSMNPNHLWIKEALCTKYPESIEAIREYLAAYGVEI